MKNKKEILYIATDGYTHEVICIGNKDEVTEALISHCEFKEYNMDDISEYISVFKGEDVPIGVSQTVQIDF